MVDQRAQQACYDRIDSVAVVHQRIHAAQQLLMGQAGRVHLGDADGLQPAQHAQLGIRITQAIEDHDANGMLDSRGVAGLAEHTAQRVKAQFLPELIQCPDIAQSQR